MGATSVSAGTGLLGVVLEAVPKELWDRRACRLCRAENRNRRPRKVPYSFTTERPRSTTTRQTNEL